MSWLDIVGIMALAAGGTLILAVASMKYSEGSLRYKLLVVHWLIALALLTLVAFKAYDDYSAFTPQVVAPPAPKADPLPPVPPDCHEVAPGTGYYECEGAPGAVFDRQGHRVGRVEAPTEPGGII